MLDFIRGNSGSFLTKLIFGIIILVFIFWGVGNYTSIGSHSVAKVNGEQISTAEFHTVINNALRNADTAELRSNPAVFENFKKSHLDRMIFSMLIRQEAKELGVFVTPQELQFVIQSEPAFLDEKGQFDKNRYLAVLKQGQITPGQFEQQILSQMLTEKLLNYIAMSVSVTEDEVHNYFRFIREERLADYILFPLGDYKAKAAPSKDEIEAYYNARQEEFVLPARAEYDYIRVSPEILAAAFSIDDAVARAEFDAKPQDYTTPVEYEVRMIVLDVPKDSGQEKAQEIGQKVHDRLAAGEKFADVAADVSIAPEAKKNGGMLGWVKEGELQADIAKILASLKPGEYSPVQRVQDSWYIFMLENRKEAAVVAFEDVRDDIKKSLAHQKAQEQYESLQQKADEGLREGYDFDKLSATLGVSKQNTGLMAVSELPALLGLTEEATASLAYLQTGKAAPAPLETGDGFVLLFVKDTRPKETPPLKDVEKAITAILVQEKSVELAKADAAVLLEALKANNGQLPDDYKGKIASSRKINRLTPQFNPLNGNAEALVSALFSVPRDVWVDQAHVLDEGVVVARVKSIVGAPEAEWATMSGLLTNALLQSKREMFIQSFMEQLNARAKIEINNDVLKTMSFS